MGVEIEVAPGIFVPRKETELLGRAALRLMEELPSEQLVVDLCCGAGNLACAMARSLARARVWAGDLCERSVTLARRNVERLGLESRVSVAQGDLFAPLDGAGLEGRIDLVMCNPPYISTSRLVNERAHLLDCEPRAAFDGGPYGLSIHQRLVREAVPFLKPGGWLAFEFGVGQWRQAELLFARCDAYGQVDFVHDEAGNPRVALASRDDVTSL